MAAEELKVVLRRNEHSGFGFSLLGTTGPPHVIYEIHENSPAADGAVSRIDSFLLSYYKYVSFVLTLFQVNL